jgi:hypothetical protein
MRKIIFFTLAFLLRSRRATGYAIASVQRTMRASTHALRMPNAKEVFFMGLLGLPTHPPTSENEVKNTSFYSLCKFLRGRGEAPPSQLFANYPKTKLYQNHKRSVFTLFLREG